MDGSITVSRGRLEVVVAAAATAAGLATGRNLIAAVMAGNDIEIPPADRDLAETCVERLASVDHDQHEPRQRCVVLTYLLTARPSNPLMRLLLPLAADAEGAATVIGRHLAGVISRTLFLGFLTEQPWSRYIRSAIATMLDAELRDLAEALNRHDYHHIGRLLEDCTGDAGVARS